MNNFYSAYKISKEYKTYILGEFPPKYNDVRCDHITYQYGVTSNKMPRYEVDSDGHAYRIATCIGYGNNGNIEALQVEFGTSRVRSDGNPFHITLSFNKEEASPKDSNKLQYQYFLLPSIKIHVTPIVLLC